MRKEDDLICDLAQYYHVFDYKGLPVNILAALTSGLPQHSRTMARINGQNPISLTEKLLAFIADKASVLVWLNSEDGRKGSNFPKSILRSLLGEDTEEKAEVFMSPEEFEAERKRILCGEEGTD